MMKKRAQAAMEFLMTYGWAILVVLLAIAALAYFGVLSPENLLPERTTFAAPIANLDNAVVTHADNSVELALINNKGVAITLPDASASTITPDSATITCGATTLNATMGGTPIVFGEPGVGTTIPNGGRFLLTWDCAEAASGAVGDKFKATLSFDYQNVETLQVITHTGTIQGKYS